MISLIWFVWVAHQFVILILLLNFLIAIVSQSYENVMQQTDFFIYNQRLELNSETILILDFLGKLPDFRTLILASLSDDARADEAANEWKGLVSNMKDHFSKIMKNQKQYLETKIQDQNDKVNNVVQNLRKEFNVMKKQIQAVDGKIDKLMELVQDKN